MRLLALLLLLWSSHALSHRPSDAFLDLEVDGAIVSGHWQLALRDLPVLLEVDRNKDQQLSWGELEGSQAELISLLSSRLRLQGDGKACPMLFTDLLVNERLDGPYAWIRVEARCPEPVENLEVQYSLLFERDPSHRGLLSLRAGEYGHAAAFGPDNQTQSFALRELDGLGVLIAFFKEGVHHIWIGLDHILFLLALLLPCVLIYRDSGWVPQPALKPVLWRVTGIVTAFTVAHSITLALAAWKLVVLPSALVESVIALSVMVAALNNVRPRFVHGRWGLAFAFGLIHGFGFASVMSEVTLPQQTSIAALAGFNLGVEIGQLLIVFLAIGLAFPIRHTAFYRIAILQLGSIAVALIAAVWLAQRSGLVA